MPRFYLDNQSKVLFVFNSDHNLPRIFGNLPFSTLCGFFFYVTSTCTGRVFQLLFVDWPGARLSFLLFGFSMLWSLIQNLLAIVPWMRHPTCSGYYSLKGIQEITSLFSSQARRDAHRCTNGTFLLFEILRGTSFPKNYICFCHALEKHNWIEI